MVGSGFLLGTEKEASWDVFVENNFFDFPMESLEGDDLDGGDWDVKLQGLGPIPSEALLGSSLASSGNIGNAACTVPSLSVHSGESPELKPLPKFVEQASRTSAPLRNGYSNGLESRVLQAPSPVSVLESSSSCSCISMSSEILIPVRTRTKRSQSSTISPWLVTPSISSTPKTSLHLAASEALSQSCDSSEFDLPNTSAEPGKRKPKKKKKLSELSGAREMMQNSRQPPVPTKQCSHCKVTKTPQWRAGPMGPKSLCNACGVRYRSRCLLLEYRPLSEPLDAPETMQNSSGGQRVATKQCSHCKVTKTPQWREGPMGRKTLCNACGVRYRSGRLLPEYRPAASPTFVPSLHSNSHRKVVELRCKAIEEAAMAESERPISPQKVAFPEAAKDEIEPPMSPPPEFIPMSGYLFDCILGSSGQYS